MLTLKLKPEAEVQMLSLNFHTSFQRIHLLPSYSFPDGCTYSTIIQMVKNLPAMQQTRVDPWVGKISWRREWYPTPAFLPGEFYGQSSLVGYSPRNHKESATTERLTSYCLPHSRAYTQMLSVGV
ncbi:hypothetical protein MG293_000455 [Ovis ammon polii]|uniref:Uncharacterized protein n=1 Tax=Ovis ammon polii TaxID=230172 RepID=A0AAD4YEK8_OVIAM|nr:hypothetical protein MG293_000455 [Ovis ammon polii]